MYFYTELWPDGKLTLTSQDETPSPWRARPDRVVHDTFR